MSEHAINLDALKFNIEQGGHSVFSPSASAMWLTCAGSLLANLAAEDNAGEDAAYGTVAHGVSETWLKTGIRPDHLLGTVEQVAEGKTVFDITIDAEMMEYVAQSVEWAQSLPGDLHIEKRVYFSQLTPIPRQGGTMDVGGFEPGVMHIFDHKFGRGVQVFAALRLDDPRSIIVENGKTIINGNSQAMLYALGALYEYDWIYGFRKIVIYISQPRLAHFQTWETTREELLRFADFVKVRAFLAWQKGAPLTPSDKGCRFCKVQKTCPALLAMAHRLSDDCFDDLTAEVTAEQMSSSKEVLMRGELSTKLLPVSELSTEQMAKLLPYRKVFERWFSEMDSELERRAHNGEDIPGMKLVASRSNRRWNVQQAKAVETLTFLGVKENALFSTDFVSPAKAEELLVASGMRKKAAEKIIAPLVAKAPGKATLAPVADTREKLGQVADDCFDDLTADDGL
ncbi:exonuclease [Burkholderia phage BcepNazgul]|uniref:Conserved phage protein n=1 Tax=Burkholderia phage BcepNazgul TaxID=242861 RepID=Q6UYG9_9CAUD|nr:exonuclease [Burkholderia phage BcepNazgul]AAQ63372.2 conserved phage protein [Burkholderia phage BcepNazgul]